jgi:hypothetical protein
VRVLAAAAALACLPAAQAWVMTQFAIMPPSDGDGAACDVPDISLSMMVNDTGCTVSAGMAFTTLATTANSVTFQIHNGGCDSVAGPVQVLPIGECAALIPGLVAMRASWACPGGEYLFTPYNGTECSAANARGGFLARAVAGSCTPVMGGGLSIGTDDASADSVTLALFGGECGDTPPLMGPYTLLTDGSCFHAAAAPAMRADYNCPYGAAVSPTATASPEPSPALLPSPPPSPSQSPTPPPSPAASASPSASASVPATLLPSPSPSQSGPAAAAAGDASAEDSTSPGMTAGALVLAAAGVSLAFLGGRALYRRRRARAGLAHSQLAEARELELSQMGPSAGAPGPALATDEEAGALSAAEDTPATNAAGSAGERQRGPHV